MEHKNVLTSSLSVGLGVGLGIGLATGRSQTFQRWTSLGSSKNHEELMEVELMSLVTEGKSSNVSFEDFPYYLSEQTKELLASAAFVYLKQEQLSKYTRNLSPASRAILLSGSAEPYTQSLAKALAHYFAAKLLLLDVTDFCLKRCNHWDFIFTRLGAIRPYKCDIWLQRKHGGGTDSDAKSFSETALDHMSSLFESFSILPMRVESNNGKAGCIWQQNSRMESKTREYKKISSLRNSRNTSASEADLSKFGSSMTISRTSLKRNSWAFDDKLLLESLYKVLVNVSKTSPVILYLRDVERLMFGGPKTYSLFHKLIKQLSGPVLILGSRILGLDKYGNGGINEKLSLLFPYNIDIKPPEDNTEPGSWKSKLEEDMKAIQFQDNRNHVSEVLAANDIECDDLGSICFDDAVFLSNYIEEIVVSAISHHLMNTDKPDYRGGRLLISSQSLAHGLNIFRAKTLQMGSNGEFPQEVARDNCFEKIIRQEVIPADKIGVTFDDIGALEDIKESLQELVMLPLRWPDLFKGGLLKPCKGILLFGPPGTGKTMLAKALATEANATFINVSMSTITAKYYGESEKIVRALFTLAAKVAPTVIFIDEVDSMLGQRSRACEHEVTRRIKNEFMAHWDGLLSKSTERVLVLAATNRPFDLDEAIIRRFERRIMVGLPNVENREKILKTLLAKENLEEGFDFKELAIMTEGYTGSDLKNLCTAAAYRPFRELVKQKLEKEKAKKSMEMKEGGKQQSDSSEQSSKDVEETKSSQLPSKDGKEKSPEEPNKDGEEKKSSEQPSKEEGESKDDKKEDTEEPVLNMRPLTMEDLEEAKNQISPSFASDGAGMNKLKEWNELYGYSFLVKH